MECEGYTPPFFFLFLAMLILFLFLVGYVIISNRRK